MTSLVPRASHASDQATGTRRVAALELLITRLERTQGSDQIGYWAAYEDERGVHHYAYTTDSAYADRSPENTLSRQTAIAAFGRALDRYRATLAGLQAS